MSLFYQECQRIYQDSKKDLGFYFLSDSFLFKNATENFSLNSYFDIQDTPFFDCTAFHLALETRIRELKNTGFEITQDDQCIMVSAVSATSGFALECKQAFQREEQAIIDKFEEELPKFSESDFIECARNDINKVTKPFFIRNITWRIRNAIKDYYIFWTNQGFHLDIHMYKIELSFKKVS